MLSSSRAFPPILLAALLACIGECASLGRRLLAFGGGKGLVLPREKSLVLLGEKMRILLRKGWRRAWCCWEGNEDIAGKGEIGFQFWSGSVVSGDEDAWRKRILGLLGEKMRILLRKGWCLLEWMCCFWGCRSCGLERERLLVFLVEKSLVLLREKSLVFLGEKMRILLRKRIVSLGMDVLFLGMKIVWLGERETVGMKIVWLGERETVGISGRKKFGVAEREKFGVPRRENEDIAEKEDGVSWNACVVSGEEDEVTWRHGIISFPGRTKRKDFCAAEKDGVL
ncbi:hypothetical protein KM043_001216 [Ampulex compressa]|nr:hypothetical protein KM043_001216 [Ampulex compressa]